MAHPPLDHRALEAAVSAGVIDSETRERLVAFADHWQAGAATSDEEQFRLLTGFNDIFVAIAIAIFLFAVGGITMQLGGDFGFVLAGVVSAAAAWLLAEYFTRRRRMALPSIELLIAFVASIGAVSIGLLAPLVEGGGPAGPDGLTVNGQRVPSLPILLAVLPVALAAWLHWRRFRVPITLAAACLAAAVPVILVAGEVLGAPMALVAAFLAGVAVFVLAMRFDASDIARVTRRTDIAFWLHLLAAPLIVHPMLSQLASPANATAALIAGLATIAIYLALAFVALVVDRRALLVSGLIYVMTALGRLVEAGVNPGAGATVTALIVGGTLLLLAALWQRARRQALVLVSDDLKALVPPAA